MLRVGLVGCGRIAEHVHLSALAGSPGVRVTALADADAGRLSAAMKRIPEAEPFSSIERMLEDGGVDAVVIASPPATHAELALAAIEAGRHVYIEKPVATSAVDARRIGDAVRMAGVVGTTGFNYRFHPLVEATRTQLAAVGPLIAIRSVFTSASRPLPQWKRSRETGGGALLDLGSHHFDLVMHLTGESFQTVWADVRDSADAEGATATVQARLASGVPVQMLFSGCATDEDRVEIVGENGRIEYDRLRSFAPRFDPPEHAYGRAAQARRAVRSFRDALRRSMSAPGDPSFVRSFGAFAEACSGRCPATLATVNDGLRSLAVVEAAEGSAASGRVVRLDAAPF